MKKRMLSLLLSGLAMAISGSAKSTETCKPCSTLKPAAISTAFGAVSALSIYTAIKALSEPLVFIFAPEMPLAALTLSSLCGLVSYYEAQSAINCSGILESLKTNRFMPPSI